jgi:predicted transcriptional regulator
MEIYLAIIKVLNNEGPITEKQLIRKAELNLSSLKQYLNFLVDLNLIVEKTLVNKTVYFSTDKAQKVGKYFNLDDDFSIFDGTHIGRID